MNNFLRYDSTATKTDIALDILKIIFPKGNYRYYPVYIITAFSLLGILFIIPVIFGIMSYGYWEVKTDSFVASMPMFSGPLTGYWIDTTGYLLRFCGYALLIYLIFIGLSFIADVIYLIVASYRWIDSRVDGSVLW